MKNVMQWLKGEPVLVISAVLALASCLVIPPDAAYLGYVDGRVLALLYCLMAVVAGMEQAGTFRRMASALVKRSGSGKGLCLVLVMLCFFSSMLVTNDVALITFVPFAVLVLGLIGRRERLIYIVVLQTIAANLGSMATPVGNPQNLYLYANFGLKAGEFFAVMVPLTLVSLAGLVAASLCVRPEGIRVTFPQKAALRHPRRLGLMGALFVLCLLSVFRVLPYQALLVIVAAALLLFARELFARVDYALLATFVCFFIFAGNVGGNETLRALISGVLEGNTALAAGVSSQVISNVPAAVLLSGFTDDWRGLLLGTNLGGLGTPIASLASLISLKAYLRSQDARPGRYMLVFLAANGVGLAVLCACAVLFSR